jgi:hypothetical protein
MINTGSRFLHEGHEGPVCVRKCPRDAGYSVHQHDGESEPAVFNYTAAAVAVEAARPRHIKSELLLRAVGRIL